MCRRVPFIELPSLITKRAHLIDRILYDRDKIFYYNLKIIRDFSVVVVDDRIQQTELICI